LIGLTDIIIPCITLLRFDMCGGLNLNDNLVMSVIYILVDLQLLTCSRAKRSIQNSNGFA
jgi:hypothetical protein